MFVGLERKSRGGSSVFGTKDSRLAPSGTPSETKLSTGDYSGDREGENYGPGLLSFTDCK